MCYHTSIPGRHEIEEAFDYAKILDEWEQNYYHLSGFDHPKTPIITSEKSLVIRLFTWGLVPGWVKDEKKAKEMRMCTLNATCENVFDKPSFKMAVQKQRCLVIVNGFFEWHENKSKKYPYYIYLKNKKPFTLAGIYDEWVNKETGEITNSYAIITCPANSLMEKIHNRKKRMPVILSKEKERKWLDNNLKKEEIQDLMIPFDDDLMGCHTVSRLITSRTENSNVADVQKVHQYAELAEQKVDSGF